MRLVPASLRGSLGECATTPRCGALAQRYTAGCGPSPSGDAEVLKSKRRSSKAVRVKGHADASGAAAFNMPLSQKRAEAVRDYLVELGADPLMILPVGVGTAAPKNAKDPFAAENRRVEIGRATPPS